MLMEKLDFFPFKTDVTVFIPSVLTHLPSLTNKHAFDEGYGQRMSKLDTIFQVNK
jgi:hypothetical protein